MEDIPVVSASIYTLVNIHEIKPDFILFFIVDYPFTL